ncbi:hypothetical protein EJ08DRAFT_18118 [Tothia fuscella]|uniref:C2H2-type domain-containing protein n=1 Tax=Tothia fuscella TaxID=1048955 RepID=A0A9P4NZ43_9PEZI|nr:hypothetical protein EJ08DRAFT_18118 [Tothia fuscella]
MDIYRNSSGRRISLLNEEASSAKSRPLMTSLPLHSRTSSIVSYNSSPPTPQLVRSNSSESSTMMNQSPSPVTPSFDFDPGSQQQHKQDDISFFLPPSDQSHPSQYPLINNGAAHFYPAPPANIAPQPQMYQAQPNPDTDSRSQPAANSKPPKKNQYPCPLSKQFNCQDFFTTSGHAARHAKKHTGKKDAFCPECNKAFTRKDNMEQHRRTHQNGRSSKNSAEGQPAKRVKTSNGSSSKRSSRPPPLQQQAMNALDPSLPQSPASSYGGGYPETNFVQPGQNAHTYPLDLLNTSPFAQNTPYPLGGPFDPALGTMNGLDTLAIAAAKRDDY